MAYPSLLSTIIVGIVTVVGARLLWWCMQFYRWRRRFVNLPGNKTCHPLFGTMHLFPGANEEGIKWDIDRMKEFKKFHRVWVGPFVPVLIFFHPDAVRILLKSSAPKPRNPYIATPYDMGFPWLGDGLLLANGAKWARNRRLLTPAFHFDILRPYMAVYNKATDILLEKIGRFADKGEPFELFTVISMCTLDIILQCAFSFTSDCQLQGETHPYVQAVSNLVELWSERSLNPLVHFNFIYFRTASGKKFLQCCDYVHQVAEEIIEKRRKHLANLQEGQKPASDSDDLKKRYVDFLDILLTAHDENNRGLTTLEIRNEVDTFLFEGHDTTTSAICWMLYSMTQWPEHQRLIQEELDDIMATKDSPFIEWDDLSKFDYLAKCLKESNRMFTPVPFIERRTTEEIHIDGYTIPADTLVAVQIWCLHNNPHVWDKPEEFQPERFDPDNAQKLDPFQFTPFSAGPRNCIGQNFAMHEMKVMLAKILHKFSLELDTSHKVGRAPRAVMRSENGIKVFAKRRQT